MLISSSTHSVATSVATRRVLSKLRPMVGRPVSWITPPETMSPKMANVAAEGSTCPGILAQIAASRGFFKGDDPGRQPAAAKEEFSRCHESFTDFERPHALVTPRHSKKFFCVHEG
jgi:hypothetical protein